MQPQRICYFAGTTADWGGASRVLFTNLRLLDRSRFEAVVLVPALGAAEKILDEMGVAHVVWGPLTEPGRLFAYIKQIIRAAFWFTTHRIALVHLNRANDWRPAELFAARLCRIPIVYHFHTVNHDRAPATRMATAICAVSHYVAQNSHTLGVPTNVIYNTVDLGRFEDGRNIRSSLGFNDSNVVVTFVGQIRKIKGLEDFIAMAQQVTGEHVRFLIVGECRDKRVADDGYSHEELQALIACEPRIQYCGYQARIQDIYRSSDVVVVPSRWEEPFGLVIIEAGAAGKPVVATRVGGIPEVIVDEQSGYIVAPGDVQRMASRVQELVDEPELRRAIGNAGRERVRHEFAAKPVRALETLYASLLTRNAAFRLPF